jgi:hypothetical protein
MSPSRAGSYKTLYILFFVVFLLLVYSLHNGGYIHPVDFDPSLLDYWPLLGAEEESSDLRRLCDQTTWTDGLWVQCHSRARVDSEGKMSVHGGLNNVRNRLQTCLRVAIDAGSGVVIPSVATRNQTAIKSLGAGEPVPASNFWDMEYMVEALGEECPQLQVRFDLKGIETKVDAQWRHYKNARYQTGTFRDMTVSLLEKAKVNITNITAENQVAIAFGDTFLAWDYEKSDELATIRKDLYRTLIYNQTLLDISSKILESPQLKHGFIGVHLRAERDWPSSFGNVGDQMRLYIEEMERIERSSPSDLKTLYVSCGKKSGIQVFREKVEPLGYQVHDKWSLLSEDPAMLERVENLMFDEKAIVEYQMLLNADFFLGPVMSTMSALIAYTRALNETGSFFPKYIFPGSTKDVGKDGLGMKRTYPKVPIMKGDSKSKLMLVNGDDIMAYFP